MKVPVEIAVALVTLLGIHCVTCDDEQPAPPNGTVRLPPAMTMDTFKAHVVGFLMLRKYRISPVEPNKTIWFNTRIFVTEISSNVFNIRHTGDEVQDNGDILCQNTSETFYGVNKTSAEFMNEAGFRYVFFSDEPNRYVVAVLCKDWEPGSLFCTAKKTYTSVYLHDDDDIDYYDDEEDDTDDGEGDKASRNIWKTIASEFTLSRDSILTRDPEVGHTDRKKAMCQYEKE